MKDLVVVGSIWTTTTGEGEDRTAGSVMIVDV
jgi:hypothetical protein